MSNRVGLVAGCVPLLGALALAGWTRAVADSAQQPSPPPSVSPLTVEPPKTVRRRVDAYVTGITRQSENEDGVPRWDSPICPAVAGFAGRQGEYLFNRLSEVATAAGAKMAPAGCAPNLLIVATDDVDQLLVGLRKSAPDVFGDAHPTTIGKFADTPRAVRVWYNVSVLDQEGAPLQASAGLQGPLTLIDPTAASHLRATTIRGFSLNYVIIDGARIKGVNIGALADYVAMVSLAQIDPDAKLGDASTVLGLFAPPPADRPQGLSDWDRAFLYALYHSDPASKLQRREIATDTALKVTSPATGK
jgi:hypothetical protein